MATQFEAQKCGILPELRRRFLTTWFALNDRKSKSTYIQGVVTDFINDICMGEEFTGSEVMLFTSDKITLMRL